MEEIITQSDLWKNLQDDLNEVTFAEKHEDYRYLAILKQTPVGNYLYLPYGPVYKDENSFKKALLSLKNIAENTHAFFIRIEPTDSNFARYAPKNAIKTTDLNPKETWLLDLSGDEADLKAKLPSRLLRYYKNASKNGITIETSKNPDDIKYLLDLQKALAKEKGINTFSENYLKTELKQPFATLYLVKRENDTWTGDGPGGAPPLSISEVGEEKVRQDPSRSILAAGLVFDYKDTRFNLQGAQSEEGKRLHATGILTIRLIEDAKKEGKKIFDFWGIAPEDAPKDHPWAGFTNFKKTFAGYEKSYAGTYDIVLKPTKYRIYKLIRKLNRMMRKF